MSYKIKFKPPQKVYNRLITKKVKLFANTTLYKLVDPYVPFREGNLAHNVDITADYVLYKVPYARRMYYGKGFKFSKDKHPLATSHWDEVAMRTRKQQLIQSIENYIERGGV